MPRRVTDNILNYESSITSEEENRQRNEIFDRFPHSPNSLFEFRTPEDRARHEQEVRDLEVAKKDSVEEPFTAPRKFSSNFEKLIKEKSRQTITATKNRYAPLTDESDDDSNDDEIGKIVKKRKKGAKFRPLELDNLQTNNSASSAQNIAATQAEPNTSGTQHKHQQQDKLGKKWKFTRQSS